jgi:Tol biopolymer transport system component/tRNA A-37 threonylcarbamoyl transferase component Bud32
MALANGTRLGPYEIVAPLGAGGMGDVYKAHDTRLNRTVAIKVLQDEAAEDAEARARFAREARAISSLDHPHICALYDVGEHQGANYLVMQHLEGQTLAERLAKGPLPIEQALQCGIQIADALDWAHRHGITHRDLKPGNVMLTRASASRQGPVQAKLLDFGLAKLRAQADPVSLSVSGATGVSDHIPTAKGTILGTIHYMAPEQVEGKDADARSDIFALGTLLYEMTTGRRPFEGGSAASVMGAILKDDPPPMTTLQPVTPSALEHVVHTCLAKDPDDRWQSVSDVKRELGWIASTLTATDASSIGRPSGKRAYFPWIAAVAGLLAALAATLPAAWRQWFAVPREQPVARFEITSPVPFTSTGGSVPVTQLAVSPDGRRIAFVAGPPGGRGALWIRSLDAAEPEMLAGTEDASYPFWSPDSRFIGFFAQERLKTVDITGGPPQVLCMASPNARGGAWNRDGVIIFSPATTTGLLRISASAGSEPTHLLDLRDGEFSYRWPSFLPDGRHFLYFVRAREGKAGIYVGSMDGQVRQLVLPHANYNAVYARSGYLLTLRNGTLLAYSFDERALRTAGEPVRVAERVGGSSVNLGSFSESSASDASVLAYAGGLTAALNRLEWFDRTGRSLGPATDGGDYVSFRLSPDGRQVAFSRVDPQRGNSDVYLMDVERRVETRFTSDPGNDVSPVWSPNGSQIVFRSDRAGGNFPFLKPSNAAAPERQLGPGFEVQFTTDWSRDGKVLVGHTNSPSGAYDVMTLALDGSAAPDVAPGAKPVAFADSEFAERDGVFSPDGRWLAYVSDASGRIEVYVAPFPRAGGARRVSVAGGSEPHWRHDGKELFYLAPDRTLMAVDVATGATLESGTPHPLFRTQAPFPGSFWRMNYDVTADGSRFLVTTPVEGSARPSPLSVVLNWPAALRK